MPQRKSLPKRLRLFGEQAASHPDVDDLLTDACQEVAGAVNVNHVKALEYLPDEKQLLVRAGIGWKPGVVGKTKLAAGLESAAGFTLQTGKPTIANDLDTEERFHIPKLLRDHGVRSAVNVLIKSQDYTFGVLEADSVEPRRFGRAEVDTLQGFANILALVIVQNRLARENFALSQKLDLLLRELAHRTKNNNQMLLSIISLQKQKANMLDVSLALDDVMNRIFIMNTIDNFLTLVDDTEKIDVPSYLGAVSGKVFSSLSASTNQVRLLTDFADCVLDRDQAQGLAIIINEFITNSFKYAFKSAGTLTVKMLFDEEAAVLDLMDDGPGVPEDVVPGLGLQIIEAMASQLEGKAEWRSSEGAHLRIILPRKLAAARGGAVQG